MQFRRNLWTGPFDKDRFPRLPCPTCSDGRLLHRSEELRIEEPKYSKLSANSIVWEPEYVVERFRTSLTCDDDQCGEIVNAVGKIIVIEEQIDEEGNSEYAGKLLPTAMEPAPPLISIPSTTNNSVKNEIRKAFSLYWSDVGSAGNRMRTSVEFLLDDLKISRQQISPKNKKFSWLSLNGRIDLYKNVDVDLSKTFDALRVVGNLGTHESDLTQDVFLDAMDLYEHALAEIYDKLTVTRTALQEKIIRTKGKY